MKTVKTICKECGIEFETTNKNKKFCCVEHTHIYHKRSHNAARHKEILDNRAKALAVIPEVYPIDYEYKEFFLRDILSVEESSFLSQMFRSNMQYNLPLKNRKVLRNDGMSRLIPSLYCNTEQIYNLIQKLHTMYREKLYTDKRKSRTKTIKLLNKIKGYYHDK